jgi:hypothetical protein
VITSASSPASDTGGSLFVRGSDALGHRWFAFPPRWAEAVTVGTRRIPVHDGIAVFAAGRQPGPVVAVGGDRRLRLRTP